MVVYTIFVATLWVLALLEPQVRIDAAVCGGETVTDPVSLRDPAGWDSQDSIGGAGQRRQGHVSAEVTAWDQKHVVVFGGTSVRTDDVNDVLGREAGVFVVDITNPANWTELEMVAYDGAPHAVFRPASFVWDNSLFVVCGHTEEPFTVTTEIWRADIQGFEEAPEGLWRPVNASKTDALGGQVSDIPRYGHTATVLNTGEANPTEAWAIVIGGMTGSQNSVDTNLILHLSESSDEFVCDEDALVNITSSYTCGQRTPTRPTETEGEWLYLDSRLSNDSKPASRSYHAVASLASNGLGGSACLYMYGGRNYEMSTLYSDLWSLCPVSNYLGNSEDTTFTWTELSPAGTLPLGRYGAVFAAGIKDAPYRILLYGGTGRYPNSYMADEFTKEYDTYMNAWVDSSLENGGSTYPVGRRDHTLEGVGDFLVLIAGINNDEEALQDMWNVNFSSDCPAGTSTTNGVGTASEDGCLPCEAGTFSLTGALECSPCPSGFYSEVRASECIPCPVGTYRQEDSTLGYCSGCAAGTYAPFEQATACLECPKGYYSPDGGATECSPCPAGTAGASVASGPLADACASCLPGEYSSEDGSMACDQCPAGTGSATDGASSEGTCLSGTFAGAGSSSCQDCVAGQYSTLDGSETCDLCPVGTYVDVTGSMSIGECEYCPQGSTNLAAGSNSTEDCLPCPPGTRTVALIEGGGCQDCPRGEYTSTYEAAQEMNCTKCVGGFFADTMGSDLCTECPEEQLSYGAHETCLTCITNTSCPIGPNGETCSGVGDCYLGVCDCNTGFDSVDCSSGTCDGCGGVFGFDYDSAVVGTAESGGTVSLALVRLVGTDGEVTVDLDVTGGNATQVSDFGGTWPIQVVFDDGQTESVVSLPVVHDNDPDEGCEGVTIGVTAVSGTGSAVVNGGIHDVSAEAVVTIEEDDFTSAVRTTTLPTGLGVGGGQLSPATAEVVIADATATWSSDVTLSVVGVTPTNRSAALPLGVLFLAESHSTVADDLERLVELLPGLVAEMQSSFSSVMVGLAAFTTTASSYDFQVLAQMMLNLYPVVVALDTLAASSLSASESAPGAQVVGLYEAADDAANDVGWRGDEDGDSFRIAAVVTGTHFAEEAGFDPSDTGTWTVPNGVAVSELQSRLSSAGVHPIFLLTDSSLEDAYTALVEEIGFGAVVAVNETNAAANNYNEDYLPRALADGLEALFSQATLLVQSDDGGFVASTTPEPDAFRSVAAGTEVTFAVDMSATVASDTGSGEVTLSFQGHKKTVITVLREYSSCAAISRSRVTGAAAAAADNARAGWLQRFHTDEPSKWTFDSGFSLGNETLGPFGVSADVLAVSCPGGC
ncbi:unnamed protein product, partial [Ectocarpus sp. 4 AP-2014]